MKSSEVLGGKQALGFGFVGIALATFLWETVVRFDVFPLKVGAFDSMMRLSWFFAERGFWNETLHTVLLANLGLTAGLALALAFGLPLALWPAVSVSLRPIVDFFRGMPSIALLPFLMLGFGSSWLMSFALVSTVTGLKMFPFIVDGVQQSVSRHSFLLSVLKVSLLGQIFLVYLPDAVFSVFQAIRVSAARAYAVVIVAGIAVSGPGLGGSLNRARQMGDVEAVYAFALAISLLGSIGFATNLLIEKTVRFWDQ